MTLPIAYPNSVNDAGISGTLRPAYGASATAGVLMPAYGSPPAPPPPSGPENLYLRTITEKGDTVPENLYLRTIEEKEA